MRKRVIALVRNSKKDKFASTRSLQSILPGAAAGDVIEGHFLVNGEVVVKFGKAAANGNRVYWSGAGTSQHNWQKHEYAWRHDVPELGESREVVLVSATLHRAA